MSTQFRRVVATGLAVVVALVMGSGLAEAAAKKAPSGKVNINTASVEQLTSLPGVGEKLAQRIVAYREKAGDFKAAEELMNVRRLATDIQAVTPTCRTGQRSGSAPEEPVRVLMLCHSSGKGPPGALALRGPTQGPPFGMPEHGRGRHG